MTIGASANPPSLTSAPTPARLSVRRLTASRPGEQLRAISFDLPAGRSLALLQGPGAAGSLLLDSIAGHHATRSAVATPGEILLDGTDIAARPPHGRGLGILSARDPLLAHLTVRENIAFPLRLRRVPEHELQARVNDALALVGLETVAAERPRRLDAAAQVRAQLARLLVFSPPVLLLDDPFRALDPLARASLQKSLRRLMRARGLTVLLLTTDRDEALLLGDMVGVLEHGVLRQYGPAALLLDRPADALVAQRLGDANRLAGQVVAVEDEACVRVRLSCGSEMEAEPAVALPVGAPCELCVRPERIATAFLSRPQAPDQAEGGAIPGTLAEIVQFGDHVQLRFRLVDGTELLVRRPPSAPAGDARPGRPALLAWQPHQARAFPVSAD